MAQVDYTALDDPDISMNSFYPRQGWSPTPDGVQDYTIHVARDDEQIRLSCHFFPSCNTSPTIFIFYSNGATALSYPSYSPIHPQPFNPINPQLPTTPFIEYATLIHFQLSSLRIPVSAPLILPPLRML